MITIQVKRKVRLPIHKSVLRSAAELAIKYTQKYDHADLTLVIGDDALLRKLNLQYRRLDAPTDVLSFPSGEIDPDTLLVYLGDVIISLPRAEQQAFTQGHAVGDELQLLVVHGTLHLLGYDHAEAIDKKKMQEAQDKVMSQLGLIIQSQL
jgi:probable rRNA maturation factor